MLLGVPGGGVAIVGNPPFPDWSNLSEEGMVTVGTCTELVSVVCAPWDV